MNDNNASIRLEQINLKLKSAETEVHILKDINLEVKQGETVAITGPSGSGKTSLMMLIAGLEKPTSGQITVAGQNITDANEDALAIFRRNTVSIVFQSFHLIPTMTALENVCVPLEFAGMKDVKDKALAALDAVGLSHRHHQYPSQLSGGEQQRVAVARAFVSKPKLLLADEPTGNLDERTGKSIIELLFSLHEKYGTTLALITHDMALANLCSRRVHISDGRIVHE